MSFLEALFAFLRSIFGKPEPEPDPDPISTVKSPFLFGGNDDAVRLDIRVFQTRELTDEKDRVAEQNVVRFLGQALRNAGYNYNITFGYDSVAPIDGEAATVDNLNWWSANIPNSNDDTEIHLLITNSGGGGIAYHGESNTRSGRYCIGPGGNIDELVELVTDAPDPDESRPNLYTNLRANIHEVGHNLGGRHSDDVLLPWPSLLYRVGSWLDAPGP